MEKIKADFFTACKSGDLKLVKELLPRYSVRARDMYKRTPLMIAAAGGRTETVKYLVRQKASLMDREGGADADTGNGTALTHALYSPGEEPFRFLFRKYVGLYKKTKRKAKDKETHKRAETVLAAVFSSACHMGDESTAKLFFDSPIARHLLRNPAASDIPHAAAHGGSIYILRQLQRLGIDITAPHPVMYVYTETYGPIYSACMAGHIETVRYLLQAGAGPNDGPSTISKGIDLALLDGNLELYRLLRKHGGVPRRDFTPAHLYASFGMTEKLREFLSNPANRETVNTRKFNSPLELACGHGHIETAKLLLDHGAPANAHENEMSCPLFGAIASGKMECVRLLIDRGADPEYRDSHKQTALHIAAKHANIEALTFFLDRGLDVNALDNHNGTPLHSLLKGLWGLSDGAAARCLRLLLDAGADIFIADNIYGTPLAHIKKHCSLETLYPIVKPIEERIKKDPVKRFFAACEAGDRDTVKGMIDGGFDVNTKNRFGLTTLYYAAMNHDIPMVRTLLTAGADANICAENGRTILHSVSSDYVYEIFSALIKHGADVNAREEHGKTPLMLAAQSGDIKRIKQLLQKGADIDAEDIVSGNTALIDALFTGMIEAALLLIDKGADVSKSGSLGMTPLIWAVKQGSTELVREMLKHGADPNVKDATGYSAHDYAEKQPNGFLKGCFLQPKLTVRD